MDIKNLLGLDSSDNTNKLIAMASLIREMADSFVQDLEDRQAQIPQDVNMIEMALHALGAALSECLIKLEDANRSASSEELAKAAVIKTISSDLPDVLVQYIDVTLFKLYGTGHVSMKITVKE